MNEITKLQKQVRELEEALEKGRKEKEKIEQELESTKKDLETARKEFEEFKAQHTKTVSELRKALRIKANRNRQAKPSGAKPGHKGYAKRIPEWIDHHKSLNPKTCPDCGDLLPKEASEIRPRHVTDILLTSRAKTTRYAIHRKYCRACKKIVEPAVPNVLPHARFGLNLMLLVMYLRLGLRLPGNKVCEYLLMLYDLKVSEGEIVHILKQLTVAFGEYYLHLEKLVKCAKIKHTDSTGWRVNGKNYFAWVFIAAGVILYKIRQRNNHKVPLTVFGKNQEGNILVVDRHSAFRTLAEKAGFHLQLCWSHILQDSKGLAESFGAEGVYVHRKLKAIYAMAVAVRRNDTPAMVEQLQGELFQLVRRHYRSATIRRFVNTLYYRDRENLFRFVTNPKIDPTNNISERELRALVIIRKISNGSRSPRGANATAMLLSVIQTLRYKKQHVLEGLQEILRNPSGW